MQKIDNNYNIEDIFEDYGLIELNKVIREKVEQSNKQVINNPNDIF